MESRSDLLTIAQTAERFGVSTACIYQWIKEGRIVAVIDPATGSYGIPADVERPKNRRRGRPPKYATMQ